MVTANKRIFDRLVIGRNIKPFRDWIKSAGIDTSKPYNVRLGPYALTWEVIQYSDGRLLAKEV